MGGATFFQEAVRYFAQRLGEEVAIDEEIGQICELRVDGFSLALSLGREVGSLHLSLDLGFITTPLPEAKLYQLASCNFLGRYTAGCTLAIDELRGMLCLQIVSSSAASFEESWASLHRLLSVGHEWRQKISYWEEIIPITLE